MRQTQDRVIKRTLDRLHFAGFDTQGQRTSGPCAAHLVVGVRFIDNLRQCQRTWSASDT